MQDAKKIKKEVKPILLGDFQSTESIVPAGNRIRLKVDSKKDVPTSQHSAHHSSANREKYVRLLRAAN